MRSKPLVYLTYGDVDSPVFETQVIGFCQFLDQSLDIPALLVSFVPLRNYWAQRKRIKAYGIDCKVFPVINRWQERPWYARLNARLIARLGARSVMTRNPRAVELCTYLQDREWQFFYDARGCNYKEMEEFSEATESEVADMKSLESKAFARADWIYSVSEQLILHFKTETAYRDHNHSIVPCCYLPSNRLAALNRAEVFPGDGLTVFCYAGALSVWNFPKSFLEICAEILKHPNYRLIILSHQIEKLDQYPFLKNERCLMRSATHAEVSDYLSITDYGILLRKKAFTNKVASPSKFADYMSNGCKVVISPELGDFSQFVKQHDSGLIYRGRKDNKQLDRLKGLKDDERQRIMALARENFLRGSDFNLIKYRNLKRLHDGL